jgi:polysaccharide chain length determinant protein (PEP-CTERM system associated)
MVDELDDRTPEESFDLDRWLGAARRRYLYFLIPLFFGWLIVWGASWVIPPVYRSGTLILVEQPTMPKDYVTPNVADDLQERLQSITQQILSRTRLLQIIEQVKVYNDDSKKTADEKVERMRKDIEIELVHDAHNDKITAFNVYYSARDPHLAQKVTSELTNLFINENVEVRQQLSEDTTEFLQNQLETARQTLSEQEEKIREFKGQHVGEMPTQQQSNLQILSGLQSQLQNAEDGLNTAKQQRIYLQTLLDQYRTLQGTVSSGGDAPESLPAIDKELERLKAQQAELSARYTDRHPDVRKLKEQIAQTEKTRDALVADLMAKSATSADDSKKTQKSGEFAPNSPMMQLQGQLHANQIEIANRERSIAELKASVAQYQGRLNQEPVREQQLADLTRGYDQSKSNYDELLKKKNESEMATNMERLQQGERFRVIDPPSLPSKPDFPNRLKFCGMGLGIGVMLGLVVAGSFELMDDRMHSEKEIKDQLPGDILVEIPEVLNVTDQQKIKRKAQLEWVTTGVVVVAILAGSAFSYLRG